MGRQVPQVELLLSVYRAATSSTLTHYVLDDKEIFFLPDLTLVEKK